MVDSNIPTNVIKQNDPLSCDCEAILLDVPWLDEFFVDWAVVRLQKILRQVGKRLPSTSWRRIWVERLRNHYVRPLALALLLWMTHGQTPATRLLGLQRGGGRRRRRRETRVRIVLYALLVTLVPTAYTAMNTWYHHESQQRRRRRQHEQQQQQPRPQDTLHVNQAVMDIRQLAAYRKFRVVCLVREIVQRVFPILRLLALLGVWSGKTQTAELAMLATGLSYAQQPIGNSNHHSKQHQVQLHVDYAQRRWVWEELTRAIQVWGQGLLLLGSVWQQDWQPALHQFCQRRWRTYTTTATTEATASATAPPCCSVCQACPMVMPVELQPCRHLACHACAWQLPHCRICGVHVVSTCPWKCPNMVVR